MPRIFLLYSARYCLAYILSKLCHVVFLILFHLNDRMNELNKCISLQKLTNFKNTHTHL